MEPQPLSPQPQQSGLRNNGEGNSASRIDHKVLDSSQILPTVVPDVIIQKVPDLIITPAACRRPFGMRVSNIDTETESGNNGKCKQCFVHD